MPAIARDANIATLMLDGPRTQTTPADEPAEEAGHEPEFASRRDRTTERVALFVAGRIERASDTYGSLGVAFTLLVWLYVVSRVIVASAMLNAALAEERRLTSEEVLHL